MEILELNDINSGEWNSLVLFHPETRFYQMLEYKYILEEVFNYKSFYLLFRQDGVTIGLLPLFLVKTLLFNKIVSIPFSEYGGIISNFPDKLNFPLIYSYLNDLLEKYRADYVEINGGLGLPNGVVNQRFQSLPFYHYAELELTSEDELWRFFDSQVKKAINKANRSGVEAFQDNGDTAIRKYFYPLFLKSMHRHGSPSLSLKYFLTCSKYFKDKMKIFFAKDSHRVIAALLGYVSGKRTYIQLIVSDESAHDKRPVDFLHWEFIKWAVNNGVRYFDFGPVRYEGQRRYKLKWGCVLKDYSFFYFYPFNSTSNKLPQPLTPLSPKIKIFKIMWGLLAPPLKNKIGPWIRWNLAK